MNLEKHPAVESFFKSLFQQIKNRKLRDEVHQEIMGHLEEKIEHLCEDGIAQETAIQQAISDLGDPRGLGRDLYRAKYPLWAACLKVAACIFVPTVAAVAGYCAVVIYTSVQMIQQEEKNILGIYPLFEEDQVILADEDLFKPSTTGLDAGEWLNGRMSWGHDSESHQQLPLYVGVDQKKIIEEAWKNKKITPELEVVDLSWISDMRRYDYWDFYLSGPYKDLSDPAKPRPSPFSAPIPDLSGLQLLAKVHLLKSFKSGNVTKALHDVHHLARLSHTSETLVGSMVAMALIKYEREAYLHAVGTKLIEPTSYAIWSEEKLKRAKRALWGVNGVMGYTSSPEILSKISRGSNFPIGACTAATENISMNMILGKYIRPQIGFEPNYLEAFSEMDQAFEIAKSKCRLTYIRTLDYKSVDLAQEMFFVKENDEHPTFENSLYRHGHYIPYVRRAIAMKLVAVAIPNFLRLYEEDIP